MQTRRREIIEAVLFLPAMAALAAVIFGIFAGIIYGAWWVFEVVTVALDPLLPRGLAGVVACAVVIVVVTGAASLVTDGLPSRARRRRAG